MGGKCCPPFRGSTPMLSGLSSGGPHRPLHCSSCLNPQMVLHPKGSHTPRQQPLLEGVLQGTPRGKPLLRPRVRPQILTSGPRTALWELLPEGSATPVAGPRPGLLERQTRHLPWTPQGKGQTHLKSRHGKRRV